MIKKKKNRKVRNIYFPDWLKLRMDESFQNQVNEMIRNADRFHAGSVCLKLQLRQRQWLVRLEVKRANFKDNGNH